MALGVNEVLQQFDRLQLKLKLAMLGIIVAGVAAAFYFLLYADLVDQTNAMQAQVAELQSEKASYEDKKQRYIAFRAEVKGLLQEKKELVKVLPTEAEIPNFLQSLHSQAELAGLNIITFDKQSEVARDFYAEIPVRMLITGTYHQINKFFYSVGQLKRIVNIRDLGLGDVQDTAQGMVLKARFVSSTYRFLEKNPG
ncbi:MAG: type 4a pilus biogenesis protein PilO [Proteobacteria bacterium]|nr:type 4a pilus biogenesis protein PilO [Pseudomonadota bacterium]